VTFPTKNSVDELKRTWSDRLVKVKPDARPELRRFEGKVGRVVTVNYGGRALVDFADGAWYDVADFEQVLEEVIDEAEKKKYNSTANSAQIHPDRQA
jgi:hypothetical protein